MQKQTPRRTNENAESLIAISLPWLNISVATIHTGDESLVFTYALAPLTLDWVFALLSTHNFNKIYENAVAY